MTEEKSEEKPSSEEMIGFHKGCISTLIKEREELIKMANVVEQIMQAHIRALKELGVDLEQAGVKEEVEQLEQDSSQKKSKKKVDIEDLI